MALLLFFLLSLLSGCVASVMTVAMAWDLRGFVQGIVSLIPMGLVTSEPLQFWSAVSAMAYLGLREFRNFLYQGREVRFGVAGAAMMFAGMGVILRHGVAGSLPFYVEEIPILAMLGVLAFMLAEPPGLYFPESRKEAILTSRTRSTVLQWFFGLVVVGLSAASIVRRDGPVFGIAGISGLAGFSCTVGSIVGSSNRGRGAFGNMAAAAIVSLGAAVGLYLAAAQYGTGRLHLHELWHMLLAVGGYLCFEFQAYASALYRGFTPDLVWKPLLTVVFTPVTSILDRYGLKKRV